MNKSSTPIGLGLLVFLRLIAGVAIIGMIFFFTAGTSRYWQAWLYMAVLFIPMTIYAIYLLKKQQTVLKRRMT